MRYKDMHTKLYLRYKRLILIAIIRVSKVIIRVLDFMEEHMKTASIAIISFILGATLSGVIGFKLVMSVGYQAVMGKLTDNVIFYRQIEEGNPEFTQAAIASSLDWFIDLANDSEDSIWVSPTEHDKQNLIKARELQLQLTQKSSSK